MSAGHQNILNKDGHTAFSLITIMVMIVVNILIIIIMCSQFALNTFGGVNTLLSRNPEPLTLHPKFRPRPSSTRRARSTSFHSAFCSPTLLPSECRAPKYPKPRRAHGFQSDYCHHYYHYYYHLFTICFEHVRRDVHNLISFYVCSQFNLILCLTRLRMSKHALCPPHLPPLLA